MSAALAARNRESAAPGPLLEFRGVSARFGARSAVEDVTFTLDAGATLALVGPSGAGKSTIGRLALGLVAPSAGSVWFAGRRLDALADRELRRLRADLQAVFQDPQRSLDPSMRIDAAVTEGLEVQGRAPRLGGPRRAWRASQAAAWLDRVGLPAQLAQRRPAELSGGEKQRVAIARAMALAPRLVVADEPVAALDAVTGANIVNLLLDLQRATGVAYLWISHHLGQAATVADWIAVVEGGRIVEMAPAAVLLSAPRHSCTRRLLAAAPAWPPPALASASAAPPS